MHSTLERLRVLRAEGRLPKLGPSDTSAVYAGGSEELTPADLPSDWRVEWEERVAIREYEGGQAREHAEAEAFTEILARMRAAGKLG